MYRLIFLAALVTLLTPESLTHASALVPCTGLDCSSCHLVEMGNNIVRWLVLILFVVFAVIMTIAGFGLVTSGGNQAALEAAKTKFKNALIGIIIVMAAWLLVDTLLKAILPGGEVAIGTAPGPWNRVECFGMTPPSLGRYALETPNPDGTFSPNSGVGTQAGCTVPTTGPCSVAALQAAGFGAQAENAARIAGQESGCNPNAESRTDTTTDGRTYSVGTWQINLAVHQVNCGGVNLDCPSAFRRTNQRNRFNVRMYEVVDESLYQQCVNAAKDPSCNNQIAAGLANRSRDMGDWACSARHCGIQTRRNHLCPL